MLKILLIALLFYSQPLLAQLTPLYQQRPIHEAFISPVGDITPIQVVPVKPLAAKAESAPIQTNPESIWIPGYWAWLKENHDYTWVCGVWRTPPPGHEWIPGSWQTLGGGWAWVRGFWSPVNVSSMQNIHSPPPNSVEENTGSTLTSDSFWVPGYWDYNATTQQFAWLKGKWQTYDPLWILVPAQYFWRPEGYVFVPMHWDWPLEKRGTAYECTVPVMLLEPSLILRRLFYSYPSYLDIYGFYWHFHPDWWRNCWCLPAWWEWRDWWWFTQKDQWSLWWWWTHPGYPPPGWMTKNLANKIEPPDEKLLHFFDNIVSPAFITPHGVPSSRAWLDAISEVLKLSAKKPLLPFDAAQFAQIQNLAERSLPSTDPSIRPNGKPPIPMQKRPQTNPATLSVNPGKSVQVPFKPAGPSEQPYAHEIEIPSTPLLQSQAMPGSPIYYYYNYPQQYPNDQYYYQSFPKYRHRHDHDRQPPPAYYPPAQQQYVPKPLPSPRQPLPLAVPPLTQSESKKPNDVMEQTALIHIYNYPQDPRYNDYYYNRPQYQRRGHYNNPSYSLPPQSLPPQQQEPRPLPSPRQPLPLAVPPLTKTDSKKNEKSIALIIYNYPDDGYYYQNYQGPQYQQRHGHRRHPSYNLPPQSLPPQQQEPRPLPSPRQPLPLAVPPLAQSENTTPPTQLRAQSGQDGENRWIVQPTLYIPAKFPAQTYRVPPEEEQVIYQRGQY